MQSKAAKIIVVVLSVLGGLGIFWFVNYGPDAKKQEGYKQEYLTYTKAEATIVSQDGNGYVGARHNTIWTIQYTDAEGKLQTTKMDESPRGEQRKNGDKINFYYDPANMNGTMIEESKYKERTK